MSNPYLGEVRMFGGNFAPIGWALCDGSLLSIPSNTALFSLIGTSYGGDGVNTFALPNLQCCVPVHTGTYQVGQALGSASTVLGLNNLPQHTHALGVSSAPATSRDPTAGVFANSGGAEPLYGPSATDVFNSQVISNTGGVTPITNLQPFVVLTFIICISGIFPSRD